MLLVSRFPAAVSTFARSGVAFAVGAALCGCSEENALSQGASQDAAFSRAGLGQEASLFEIPQWRGEGTVRLRHLDENTTAGGDTATLLRIEWPSPEDQAAPLPADMRTARPTLRLAPRAKSLSKVNSLVWKEASTKVRMCRSVSSAPLVPRLQVEAQADTESVSLLAAHRKHSNAAFVLFMSVAWGRINPKTLRKSSLIGSRACPSRGRCT